MTKRNIAIANFSPAVVRDSSWPRFVGWKMIGNPKIESGLFGLIDRDVRMHRFFKDTTIKEVLRDQLLYTYHQEVTASPLGITYEPDFGRINMPKPKAQDHSIRWLPMYHYTDAEGTVWDVYVIITGDDIHITGDFHRIFKAEGYWDMGIWKPKLAIGEVLTDIHKIEQATINHVVANGYPAMKPAWRMDKDDPRPIGYTKDGVEYFEYDVTA